MCTNEKCLKIPFKGEFDKMEVINENFGHYKSLNCSSVARKDLKKQCRSVIKLEERKGTYFSCGVISSKNGMGYLGIKQLPLKFANDAIMFSVRPMKDV